MGDNGQLIPACAFWLLGDEVLLEEDNFENLREKKMLIESFVLSESIRARRWRGDFPGAFIPTFQGVRISLY